MEFWRYYRVTRFLVIKDQRYLDSTHHYRFRIQAELAVILNRRYEKKRGRTVQYEIDRNNA